MELSGMQLGGEFAPSVSLSRCSYTADASAKILDPQYHLPCNKVIDLLVSM